MRFKLLPVLERMKDIYLMPRTEKRFKTYLQLLQGKQGEELQLPIAGFNPMGADWVLGKIEELQKLEAESIAIKELQALSTLIPTQDGTIIQVVLNVVDDIGGSWSNFSTTDYTNTFDFGALLKRNFCTPLFWTSETFSEKLIATRIKSTVLRAIYWSIHAEPISLQDCFEQEVYVQHHLKEEGNHTPQQFEAIERFYQEHAASEDYLVLFNFFYGDEASQQLGYTTYGRKPSEGFQYAKYIASTKVGKI